MINLEGQYWVLNYNSLREYSLQKRILQWNRISIKKKKNCDDKSEKHNRYLSTLLKWISPDCHASSAPVRQTFAVIV